MNYMRATRKEANPVEATENTVLDDMALDDMALGNLWHQRGSLWSRPNNALLGTIPRLAPV